MADAEEIIKAGYQQKLDPKEFQKFKLAGLKDEKKENNYDFWFKCLHEFFSSGNYSGDRLLELGSGPTVHTIATASGHFPHIVQSEFVEGNCESLRKWMRKDDDRIDWTPFLKRVARAEGRSDINVAVPEIESRIRSSVKAIVHCDVLEDQIIPKEYSQLPYDVVVTSLTFETAAANVESYSKILGRVYRLLNTGGTLIMIGATKCSYWQVVDNKFHCLPLDETDIEKCLVENGFGNIEWKFREFPDDELPFNCKKLYFVTSTKI